MLQVNQPDVFLGAVLYCDGSARPNPGFIGWGSHGYIYTNNIPKKPTCVNNYFVTDKGYLQANQVSRRAASYVEVVSYIDSHESVYGVSTNNNAEVLAVYNMLSKLIDKNLNIIHIYSDSEYTITGLRDRCNYWFKNSWKRPDGTFISNHESWKKIYDVYVRLKEKNVIIELEWIKGHNGHQGNVQADILSVVGMNKATKGIHSLEYTENPALGYWKTEVDKHPFINFKKIYFNSKVEFNKVGQYFQADPGKDEHLIGKRTPETALSIIRLHTPNDVIELIRNTQFSASDYNSVMSIRLDNLFHSDIYPYIVKYGDHAILVNKNNLNLEFVNKVPLTTEFSPTGLSLRAIDYFNYLEEILDRYMDAKAGLPDSSIFKIKIHDITNQFYNVFEKIVKKENRIVYEIKPTITNAINDIKLTVLEDYSGVQKEYTVPIILGSDIVNRNTLKKIEVEDPNIFLVTWKESENSFRYATIIDCKSGVGIWSNYFSDRVLL